MIPMQWIQPFVKELSNQPLPRRKAAMQHISVKQVLNQGPSETADGVKPHGEPRMARTSAESKDRYCIQRVEHAQRVEPRPGERGLALLVDVEGNISHALVRHRNSCAVRHQSSPPMTLFVVRKN